MTRPLPARVRAVQERRRSNAAGPHHGGRAEDEPCLCGTQFTCLARQHDDEADRAARRAALDEMVRLSEEMGLYELTDEPVQIKRLAESEEDVYARPRVLDPDRGDGI